MRACWKVGVAAVLSAGGAMAAAQNSGAEKAGANVVVRVLDDACTGNRWLLERNSAHPGGPGLLVRIKGGMRGAAAGSGERTKPVAEVIHAGDSIVLEEKTAVVQARLEAMALESATRGEKLRVRLALGGRVVYAMAEAPHKARLIGEAWR